jgi:hypothetical protein
VFGGVSLDTTVHKTEGYKLTYVTHLYTAFHSNPLGDGCGPGIFCSWNYTSKMPLH